MPKKERESLVILLDKILCLIMVSVLFLVVLALPALADSPVPTHSVGPISESQNALL